MEKQFFLEIYEPGSIDEVAAVFESDKPFMTPVVGHLINPSPFQGSIASTSGELLRVMSVENIIWQHKDIAKQKICVYTKAVPNDQNVKLGKRMDLTLKERVIIANQLAMLQKLNPDEADYYEQHETAIRQGYTLHYDWLAEWFYDELSEQECQEVLDILEMYRAITFSSTRLTEQGVNIDLDIKFHGFDGNNESSLCGYTLYFIGTLGRYKELQNNLDYPDFNSHMPMLEKYRIMLNIWKHYPDKYEMTKEQLNELLRA